MRNPTPNDIRRQVMKERGITTFAEKGKKRHLTKVSVNPIPSSLKTPLMRYWELVLSEPIERILLSGSLTQVSKRMDNEVDTSTLSKWIKRLKLHYSEENLPSCSGCMVVAQSCEVGICPILMDQGLYELVMVKRREVVDGQDNRGVGD